MFDYHKIKSYDKNAIEVFERVEATEALGFQRKFFIGSLIHFHIFHSPSCEKIYEKEYFFYLSLICSAKKSLTYFISTYIPHTEQVIKLNLKYKSSF